MPKVGDKKTVRLIGSMWDGKHSTPVQGSVVEVTQDAEYGAWWTDDDWVVSLDTDSNSFKQWGGVEVSPRDALDELGTRINLKVSLSGAEELQKAVDTLNESFRAVQKALDNLTVTWEQGQ